MASSEYTNKASCSRLVAPICLDVDGPYAGMARVCLHVALSGRTVLGVCVCARVPIRRNQNQRCTCRWLNLQRGGGVERREPAIRSTFHHVVAVRSAEQARPALCLDSPVAGFTMRPRATWARLSWGKLSKILTVLSVPEESPLAIS